MIAIWLSQIQAAIWYPSLLCLVLGLKIFCPNFLPTKQDQLLVVIAIFLFFISCKTCTFKVKVRGNRSFCFWVPFLLALTFAVAGSDIFSFFLLSEVDPWLALETFLGSFVGLELSGIDTTSSCQRIFFKIFYPALFSTIGTLLLGFFTPILILLTPFSLPVSLFFIVSSGFAIFYSTLNNREQKKRVLEEVGFHGKFFVVLCFALLYLPSFDAFYGLVLMISNLLYLLMYLFLFLSGFFAVKKSLALVVLPVLGLTGVVWEFLI